MDDVFGMGAGDGVADFPEDDEKLCKSVAVDDFSAVGSQPGQDFLERQAGDEFHRIEISSMRIGAEVVDRDDVWMLESTEDECFLNKTADDVGMIAVFGCSHFQCDWPLKLAVECLINDPHPALIEGLQDFVARDHRCGRRWSGVDGQLWLAFYEGLDFDLGFTERDELSKLDLNPAVDAFVVDERPVSATDIFDFQSAIDESEPCVFSGNFWGRDRHRAGWITAQQIFSSFQLALEKGCAALADGYLDCCLAHSSLCGSGKSEPPRIALGNGKVRLMSSHYHDVDRVTETSNRAPMGFEVASRVAIHIIAHFITACVLIG